LGGRVVESMNLVTRGPAKYRGHPKGNSQPDAGRSSFEVLDRTASLAKLERKLTSFFQWPLQTDGAAEIARDREIRIDERDRSWSPPLAPSHFTALQLSSARCY
jgi:hypothetical protein